MSSILEDMSPWFFTTYKEALEFWRLNKWGVSAPNWDGARWVVEFNVKDVYDDTKE